MMATTTTNEAKILKHLIKHLDKGPNKLFNRSSKIILWIAIVLILILVFQITPKIGYFAISAISMAIGALIGAFAVYETSYNNWPIVKNYIDRNAIEIRLRELEP